MFTASAMSQLLTC